MRALLDVSLLFLSAVFVVSGAGKLAARHRADEVMGALRLSGWHARSIVVAVAVVELLLSVLLVSAGGAVLVTTCGAAAALMTVFLVVALRARRLGSTDECGCFGDVVSTPVGGAMIVRNTSLALLAMGALLSATTIGDGPSVLQEVIGAPIVPIASAALAALLAVVVWTLGATDRSWPGPPAVAGALAAPMPAVDAPGDAFDTVAWPPSLLLRDGLRTVDVRQEALRGRAQLLVFVRPTCGSCVRTAERLDLDHDLLGRTVATTLVTAVGGGGAVDDQTAAFDAMRTAVAVDVDGALARLLGLADAPRPAAALISTSGRVVGPLAIGVEEVGQLLDAILEAGRVNADARRDGAP